LGWRETGEFLPYYTLNLPLLRGERVGVEGNAAETLIPHGLWCLLRGERVGVEGNLNNLLQMSNSKALAKGRKSWGGGKRGKTYSASAIALTC